jgi:hypothetical protein
MDKYHNFFTIYLKHIFISLCQWFYTSGRFECNFYRSKNHQLICFARDGLLIANRISCFVFDALNCCEISILDKPMNNSIYIFVKILISITYIFCFTVYVYFLFIELVMDWYVWRRYSSCRCIPDGFIQMW